MRRRRSLIQRQRIDMAPVQAFLTGSTSPVYGDDPRSPDGRKVFSAAPLRVDGQLRGYLYIILQGRRLISWRPTPAKTLWSIVLWTLLLVALFGLLAGGWHGSGSPGRSACSPPVWRRAAVTASAPSKPRWPAGRSPGP